MEKERKEKRKEGESDYPLPQWPTATDNGYTQDLRSHFTLVKPIADMWAWS